MLLRSFPIVALAVWLLPLATGQTTDATCLPFYAWTNNSRKQSPCQVAATLLAACGSFEVNTVCHGTAYNVAALPVESHYTGPSLAAANACQCSTVVYSLMSACGACQGRKYENFPKSIPPDTFVPGWAYMDVKANGIFNETAAKLSANSTAESTALPIPTSTSISFRTTISSTASKEASPASTSSTAGKTTSSTAEDNAVIGAIVGGTVGFAIIIGFIHWFLTRRRRIAESGIVLTSPVEESQPQELQTADMQQYLANTAPVHLAASSINTSLASPSSAQFSFNLSAPGSSIRSEARTNV
ncbi:hypothetical protein FPV67DRAFT_1684714 [Lyophyllum atratum]|nr:hypothetical protein FPV67DRAFT_1684714 [Lyophyllum atratum]